MTYLHSWEEFEKGAERLYLQNPMQTRYTMKYCHSKGILCLKLTDNRRVSQQFKFYSRWIQIYRFKFFKSFENNAIEICPQCLQYKTEIAQDLKKMEKFIGNLMRHMASRDS